MSTRSRGWWERQGRRECNDRSKDVLGISEDKNNLGKELERDHDKVGAYGATFSFAKSDIYRLASDSDVVRGRSNLFQADQKDAVKR